jgi:hypothetical protein
MDKDKYADMVREFAHSLRGTVDLVYTTTNLEDLYDNLDLLIQIAEECKEEVECLLQEQDEREENN